MIECDRCGCQEADLKKAILYLAENNKKLTELVNSTPEQVYQSLYTFIISLQCDFRFQLKGSFSATMDTVFTS